MNGHLCTFRSEPAEKECLEFLWSQGKACRTCFLETCYRYGWTKAMADADNRQRVKEKLEALDK
jgi:hypothetical protein